MDTDGLTAPPIAKIVPTSLTTLDDVRIDNYYWLRDKEQPDVVRYLDQENEYTAAVMNDTAAFQSELYEEMLARIQEDDSEVPHRKGNYEYFDRTEKGRPYPIRCRRFGTEGKEEILLDQNELARNFRFFALGL